MFEYINQVAMRITRSFDCQSVEKKKWLYIEERKRKKKQKNFIVSKGREKFVNFSHATNSFLLLNKKRKK